MDPKRRIAAWAYIIAMKKYGGPSTQHMGRQIEEALQQFFLTGVLPLSIDEFYKDYPNYPKKE